MYFGIFDVEHARDVGTCQVNVEDADFIAEPREGKSQLHGDRGFTDATFAGEDLRGVVSVAASSRMTRCGSRASGGRGSY